MSSQIPEIRLYRILRAFAELQKTRVIVLDRIAAINPLHLDRAENCLEEIAKLLRQAGSEQDALLSAEIVRILKPEWESRS